MSSRVLFFILFFILLLPQALFAAESHIKTTQDSIHTFCLQNVSELLKKVNALRFEQPKDTAIEGFDLHAYNAKRDRLACEIEEAHTLCKKRDKESHLSLDSAFKEYIGAIDRSAHALIRIDQLLKDQNSASLVIHQKKTE